MIDFYSKLLVENIRPNRVILKIVGQTERKILIELYNTDMTFIGNFIMHKPESIIYTDPNEFIVMEKKYYGLNKTKQKLMRI